jgi:hypothetical protein
MRWLPMSGNCQVLIESVSTLVGSGISCESPAIALDRNRERTRKRNAAPVAGVIPGESNDSC